METSFFCPDFCVKLSALNVLMSIHGQVITKYTDILARGTEHFTTRMVKFSNGKTQDYEGILVNILYIYILYIFVYNNTIYSQVF